MLDGIHKQDWLAEEVDFQWILCMEKEAARKVNPPLNNRIK